MLRGCIHQSMMEAQRILHQCDALREAGIPEGEWLLELKGMESDGVLSDFLATVPKHRVGSIVSVPKPSDTSTEGASADQSIVPGQQCVLAGRSGKESLWEVLEHDDENVLTSSDEYSESSDM